MALTRAHIALWAALSGVLWALAWPAIGGLSLLAFVAWLPLLHAERLHDKRLVGRRRAFTPYALLALLVWNASCSWWFFGVSEPIGTRLVSGLAPMVLNALFMLVPWWLKRLTRRIAGANLAAIAFIAYWLAFERLHHDWDLKWPWFSIGNVLGTRPQWIQWYEYTGMLGGSAWVLLVTLFLDRAVVRARRDRRTAWANATVAFILLLLPITGSLIRFTTIDEADSDQVEVVVVQPNIDPYSEKFGGLDAMAQLDRMLGLA